MAKPKEEGGYLVIILKVAMVWLFYTMVTYLNKRPDKKSRYCGFEGGNMTS